MFAMMHSPAIAFRLATLMLICVLQVSFAFAKDNTAVWREFPELSSHEVIAFEKDASGCLWLATSKGLCRFDGYNLRLFRSGRDNRVRALTVDKDQNIWFGTWQGAYMLKANSEQSTPVDTARIKWKPVTDIQSTPDGSIWISQHGVLRRFDAEGNWVNDYPLTDRTGKPTTLSGFCHTRNNEIFITTYSPFIYRYNRKDDKFDPIANIGKNLSLGKIIEDFRENYLWIADHSNQIHRFSPDKADTTGAFVTSTVSSPDDPAQLLSVHDMAQDISNGNIWVAGRTLMMLFQKMPDGHLLPLPHNYAPMLKGTAIETLASSDEGIWVSTFGYKTMLVPYSPENVHSTLFGWESTKREPLITAIQEDDVPGFYWIIQNRNGLLLYDEATSNVDNHDNLPQSASLRLHVASDIIPSRKHGGVWVLQERSTTIHRLTNNGGKIRYEQTISPAPEVPADATALTAIEDYAGNIWIATTEGAFRYNADNGELIAIAAPGRFITDITQTSDKNIWLATRNRGLFHFTTTGEIVSHPEVPSGIVSLTAAPNGTIWCATDSARIISFKPEQNTAEDITPWLPAHSDDIYDIVADMFGHIWIKTQTTLIEYNPQNNAYRTHRVPSITSPVEVFLSKFSFGNNGNIAIGGIGGAEIFYPSNSLDRKNARVNVSITEISATDSKQNTISKTIRQNDPSASVFRFPATLRNLSIAFSTLNYKHVSKVRYAYRMYPYEHQWNFTDENHNTAFYNQIPHGKYQFQLRASDENGVMSDNYSSYDFTFTPALYQTWWAYTAYALLGLVAIFLLIRFNLRLQRRKNERMWNDSSEMIKMRKYLETPSPTQKPEYEELDKALFNKAVSVIENNLSDPDFGVDSFAREMNMSRSTLSRKLKLIYSGTPLDLIRDIRMRHAKALLASPDMNVADVAVAVGFPDRRYFSSSFKKAVGMSPSEYQRTVRPLP